MSDTFSAQLLKEIENELILSDGEEDDNNEQQHLIKVKYEMIAGFRINSELLWAYEEKQLYYKNSNAEEITAYTCRVKGCYARVFVRKDKSAFRDSEREHSYSHGTQYQQFKAMYCDNKMKEMAKTAPASMTPYDIYMQVVVE